MHRCYGEPLTGRFIKDAFHAFIELFRQAIEVLKCTSANLRPSSLSSHGTLLVVPPCGRLRISKNTSSSNQLVPLSACHAVNLELWIRDAVPDNRLIYQGSDRRGYLGEGLSPTGVIDCLSVHSQGAVLCCNKVRKGIGLCLSTRNKNCCTV